MNPKGRKALVTGSTSGIGLGIAQALAGAGCAVMLNGFGDPEAIAALTDELRQSSGQAVFYDGSDLTEAAGCRALVSASIEQLGGLDIVVNNAGMQHVAPLAEFPAAKWDAVLALNLSAPFHITAAAVPAMRAGGWGRVINVASVHGLVASTNKSAYVAAKHGLIGLTKTHALELACEHITVNAICPGFVRTPLIDAQIDMAAARTGQSREEAAAAMLIEKQPSLEFSTPEQLGALCVFLASDAASNMTGGALTMDGGWTAQ